MIRLWGLSDTFLCLGVGGGRGKWGAHLFRVRFVKVFFCTVWTYIEARGGCTNVSRGAGVASPASSLNLSEEGAGPGSEVGGGSDTQESIEAREETRGGCSLLVKGLPDGGWTGRLWMRRIWSTLLIRTLHARFALCCPSLSVPTFCSWHSITSSLEHHACYQVSNPCTKGLTGRQRPRRHDGDLARAPLPHPPTGPIATSDALHCSYDTRYELVNGHRRPSEISPEICNGRICVEAHQCDRL